MEEGDRWLRKTCHVCGRQLGTSEDPFWTSDLDWNRLRYRKTLTLLVYYRGNGKWCRFKQACFVFWSKVCWVGPGWHGTHRDLPTNPGIKDVPLHLTSVLFFLVPSNRYVNISPPLSCVPPVANDFDEHWASSHVLSATHGEKSVDSWLGYNWIHCFYKCQVMYILYIL